MINTGDVLELKIESVGNEGQGVAKVDGYAVFVPNTCRGDVVKAEITLAKKSFARAKVLEVITPSELRVTPECGLCKVCGGCQLMHIRYDEQLNIKKDAVRDCLKKIGGIETEVKETVGLENPFEYRCKVQYPVQQTKVSRRFLIGYYKENTHEIVNIKRCPVQPSVIDDITEFVRVTAQELELTAYNEKKKYGLIRHIVYRYSHTNNNILITFVINDEEAPEELYQLAQKLQEKFSAVSGVVANFNTSPNNVIMGKKSEVLLGNGVIEETLSGRKFEISSGSFFQVNPAIAEKLFQYVHDEIKSRIPSPSVLDMYAGGAAFSIFLSDIASSITAVESSQTAADDAEKNMQLNSIDPDFIDYILADAQQALDELKNENKTFDVVVLDPPRKGCEPPVLEKVAEMANSYIIYVSCNPATLARDLKILKERGFEVESAQPFDMFCNTYHVETVAILKKVG